MHGAASHLAGWVGSVGSTHAMDGPQSYRLRLPLASHVSRTVSSHLPRSGRSAHWSTSCLGLHSALTPGPVLGVQISSAVQTCVRVVSSLQYVSSEGLEHVPSGVTPSQVRAGLSPVHAATPAVTSHLPPRRAQLWVSTVPRLHHSRLVPS